VNEKLTAMRPTTLSDELADIRKILGEAQEAFEIAQQRKIIAEGEALEFCIRNRMREFLRLDTGKLLRGGKLQAG